MRASGQAVGLMMTAASLGSGRSKEKRGEGEKVSPINSLECIGALSCTKTADKIGLSSKRWVKKATLSFNTL